MWRTYIERQALQDYKVRTSPKQGVNTSMLPLAEDGMSL